MELIPFILPSVFHVVEMGTSDDFATVILPLLVPIFPLERPYQVRLLENSSVLTILIYSLSTTDYLIFCASQCTFLLPFIFSCL